MPRHLDPDCDELDHDHCSACQECLPDGDVAGFDEHGGALCGVCWDEDGQRYESLADVPAWWHE